MGGDDGEDEKCGEGVDCAELRGVSCFRKWLFSSSGESGIRLTWPGFGILPAVSPGSGIKKVLNGSVCTAG